MNQDPKIVYQKFSDRCYQLVQEYKFVTQCRPAETVTMPYITLEPTGQCTLARGFVFDGASGPVIQTKTILRAACEHDAKYRLMREGLLDAEANQLMADAELRARMLEDGVNLVRADYFFTAVHGFGSKSTIGGNPIEEAP